MTRQAVQIVSPIPAAHLPAAARLWWAHFGRARRPPPPMRPDHGIAALDAEGRVAGVLGLRDGSGGLLTDEAAAGWPWLYRAAPETADLVIDGVAVNRLRSGAGRALVQRASAEARRRGRPGLRAEVRLRNEAALAFWRSLGFVEVTRGRYGWPWSGRVVVMRLALT
ncbi:GNAT family N-acetyltransferase [Paracoccus tibetensis]|uniref:Acetyltransferase (GNAT) family protein n=1 Tax=Paracoccus tibetensis TaxID=336292 RepID=A0A1G5ITJ7_9RHOB|nr:GNAT family N-acetyltransferase [Paracoccus tibetensis]SCY79337.1 Acetyltransferase (GNAT) family protein [Paracoccus tibetensis]